ncbi:MAG TPA: hypothetical protein VGN32_17135 [Ktedonobacterales bacterium]|jgi:hypothetical protein|nr:hypothetical protein [Ktedonobacterales bacterium]
MPGTPTIKEEIDRLLDQLAADDLERVLVLARCLAQTPHAAQGVPRIPAQDLIGFFQRYPLTPEEQANMRQILAEIEP